MIYRDTKRPNTFIPADPSPRRPRPRSAEFERLGKPTFE